jgi:hypothetical protein
VTWPLPEDLETAFPTRDAGDLAHRRHHDALHKALNTHVDPSSGRFSDVVKTYQFEVDSFKKGSNAPTEVLDGTAPEVRGMRLSNTNQRLAFTMMTPLDARAADMQMMFQCYIPAGQTYAVGDIINLRVEHRTNPGGGLTKVTDTGVVSTTQSTSVSSPFVDGGNDNVIVEGGTAEFSVYMPHVFIPEFCLTPGQVFYGEVSLNSNTAPNVPSIVIYQMHINYFGSM